MSAVSPLTFSLPFTSAPRSMSALTAAVCPACAASISGVAPLEVGRFGSAPAARSTSTTGALPRRLAMSSGVYPPTRVVALMFAPAYSSVCASSTSPFCTAQCSAVIPSPCAVFTSAPCLSSARTASRLPCIAASATGEVPAADSSAVSATAASVEFRIVRIIA